MRYDARTVLTALRLSGGVGPLPSPFFLVLGVSSVAAAVALAVLFPFGGPGGILSVAEVAGLLIAGAALFVTGLRRRRAERRGPAAPDHRSPPAP